MSVEQGIAIMYLLFWFGLSGWIYAVTNDGPTVGSILFAAVTGFAGASFAVGFAYLISLLFMVAAGQLGIADSLCI